MDVGLIHDLGNTDNSTWNSTAATGDAYPTDYAGIWGLWDATTYPCRNLYNSYFEDSSEFDKAGSAAASTILALLPALLAFGPLKTANIGLLIQLTGSSSVGLMAAASAFGLQVEQLSTLPQKALVTVKDFFKHGLWAIEVYGSCGNSATTEARPRAQGSDNINAVGVVDEATGGGTRPDHNVISRELTQRLLALQTKARNPKRLRPKRWLINCIDVTALVVQASLVTIMSVVTVFVIDDINFIWLCPGGGILVFASWLVVSLLIVGFIRGRYESSSFKATSIFHLSHIPTNVMPIRCHRVSVKIDLWADLEMIDAVSA